MTSDKIQQAQRPATSTTMVGSLNHYDRSFQV